MIADMEDPPRVADDCPVAGDEYAVELVAYTGPRALRRLALTVAMALAAVVINDLGGPSVGQLVVRRRDGTEVLRIDAGNEEEAALLVGHVREQLATLSPDEFRERWDIGPSA
jgi:hypothetical protein